MEKRTGIVLKTYFSLKRKISVLDQENGRIDYVTSMEDICTGTLIRYGVHLGNGAHFIHDIDKIGLPLLLARQDLLFFHHILELCYFFIPSGSDSLELFSLIEYLYSIENNLLSSWFKKVFLVKFFMIIGMYPEESGSITACVHRLSLIPIDKLFTQEIDLDNEKELDVWLKSCVSAHPAINKFKTVHFLDNESSLS